MELVPAFNVTGMTAVCGVFQSLLLVPGSGSSNAVPFTLVDAPTGIATVIENDVRALTVAEQWFGAGAGLSSFAVITVGTGIGAGLSIDGHVVTGAHGVVGEVGHLPVDGADRMCTCGNTGCVEAVASTQAIVEQARQVTGDSRLTMSDTVRLARAGDEAVRAVFSRAGHALGLAIASVANLIGPERIIISGEGVASYDLFAEQIRLTFGAAKDCDLIVRPLPFEEWARGGAAVAAQRLVAPTRAAGSRRAERTERADRSASASGAGARARSGE